METTRNSDSIKTIPGTTVYSRLGLVIAGIATAIICSMALLNEVRSTGSAANRPYLIETSKAAATDTAVKIANEAIVTTMAMIK